MDSFFLSFVALVVIGFSSTSNAHNCSRQPNELQFLFMASNNFNTFFTYSSLVGVNMALDRINSNSSLLSNFTLNYSNAVDSQCLRTPSLSKFLTQRTDPCSYFLAVIGSGCSVATDPVAEISSFWGLSHVSFASSSVHLRNRDQFLNYFQVYPSENNYIPGIASLMMHYGWRRVVIITEKVTLFTETEKALMEILVANSTMVTKVEFGSNDDPADIANLFPENGRIFFLNMWEPKARQVMCQAYRRGLNDKTKYSWIVYGWYGDQWWNVPSSNDNQFSCLRQEVTSVVMGSLAVQQYPINGDVTKNVIGNLSYDSFYLEYNRLLRDFVPPNSTYVAHMAYDAVWALALALDRVANIISSGEGAEPMCNGTLIPLDEWNNSVTATSCLIRHELGRTNFEGLTGQVSFDSDGIRSNSPTRIYQIRNDELVYVARWFEDQFTYLNGESDNTVFPNGIPLDGTPIRILSTFHLSLVVITYIISFAGLVFATVCLVFTFYFRNKKLIRLISPNLNYFIIAGTMMVFFSIFLRTFPFDANDDEETYKKIRITFCYISLYLDFIGYTIAFSTILSKMWRIYYIFHNPSPNKKILTDWHLIGLIIAITAGMTLILVIGSAIPQTRLKLSLEKDREHSDEFNDRGVPLDHYVYQCFNSSSFPWLLFLYIYLGLLQIIALILAIQTRKVRIKILNDSKEVAAIIYITSIVLVELAIVSFALSSFNNIHEALYDFGLLLVAIVILLLIFVPKMFRLYKDPSGENCIDNTAQTGSSIEIGKGGALRVISDKEKIAQLQTEVLQLKSQLGEARMSIGGTSAQNGGKKGAVSFLETSLVDSVNETANSSQ